VAGVIVRVVITVGVFPTSVKLAVPGSATLPLIIEGAAVAVVIAPTEGVIFISEPTIGAAPTSVNVPVLGVILRGAMMSGA